MLCFRKLSGLDSGEKAAKAIWKIAWRVQCYEALAIEKERKDAKRAKKAFGEGQEEE